MREREGERGDEEGGNATPMTKRRSLKAGKEKGREKEKEKARRVGFAAAQPAAVSTGVRGPGPAPRRPEAPKEVVHARGTFTDEIPEQEMAVERRVEGGQVFAQGCRSRGDGGDAVQVSRDHPARYLTIRSYSLLYRTSRDVQNLHLELIRGTFAQKVSLASFRPPICDGADLPLDDLLQTEMKALMKQHLGVELQQLREENARLREEKARLKRGY